MNKQCTALRKKKDFNVAKSTRENQNFKMAASYSSVSFYQRKTLNGDQIYICICKPIQS